MNHLTPSSGETIVIAENLSKKFGSVQALNGVSLKVSTGEVFGLIGPDGAGKTTTMRILAGMIKPDGGAARILGMDPLGNNQAVRNALGYMPQQYSLYGDLTVEENLQFFSRMFCLPRRDYQERRERLMHITRLAPFGQRRADALSGGMYKKLALACALLPRPRLLLMDEPTNGVDPVSRRELWTLLFELATEGMAILVTTPYMDEAARCHYVGLIHRGKLLIEGPPQDLLRQFSQPIFKVQSEAKGSFMSFLNLIERYPGVISYSSSGTQLRLILRPEAIASLQQSLQQLGGTMEAASPDFEDLFLTLATEH